MKGDADTVIVAAKHAWDEYRLAHAYVRKPSEPIKLCNSGVVKHMGFYFDNQIYPHVASIIDKEPGVLFKRGRHRGGIGRIVELLLDSRPPLAGRSLDVYILSDPQDPDTTINLGASIPNDLGYAFTRRFRYVRLKDLEDATSTSELE